jgi:hypothetical protein
MSTLTNQHKLILLNVLSLVCASFVLKINHHFANGLFSMRASLTDCSASIAKRSAKSSRIEQQQSSGNWALAARRLLCLLGLFKLIAAGSTVVAVLAHTTLILVMPFIELASAADVARPAIIAICCQGNS